MASLRRAVGAVLLGVGLFSPSSARAEGEPGAPSDHEPLAVAPLRADQKRARTVYGGTVTKAPAHALLWVPRVTLYPLYAVWSYGVRAPLGWLTTTAERNQWPTKIFNFFTFGPDHNAGIVPTAMFDFGIRPSVGVFAFSNRALHDNNSVNARFGTWGPKWLNIGATDRLRVGPDSSLGIEASLVRRPDTPYFGMGPRTLSSERVRYTSLSRDIALFADLSPTSTAQAAKLNEGADAPPSKLVRVLGRVGLRDMKFREGIDDELDDDDDDDLDDDDDDDDLDDPRDHDDMGMKRAIRSGRIQAPPGFNGYTNFYQRLELQIDTRPRRPRNQSGLRVTFEGEHGSDVARGGSASWIRYGSTLAGFVDVGKNRSLGLAVTATFADPLRGEVPFTEQIVFGGAQHMRGFLRNRLIGRSGAVAMLEYKWPIWMFVDGTVQGSVGNVFGPHLEGFSAKLLRVSGAIGLRTSNTPNQSFEAVIGVGTETFADALQLSSIRIVLGTSQL